MSVVFTLDPKHLRKPKLLQRGSYDDGYVLEGDNGSSVILIHGLTGTPVEVRFLAGFLNRKGYTAICPRLANHGEDISVLKHTRWQDFYRSVRDAEAVKRAVRGAGRLFVAGQSMGALLALVFADEFSRRVSAVTCLAPTLFYDGWNTPGVKYFLPLARTPLRHFFYFKEEPPYGIRNEAIQNRVHKYYSGARLEEMDNVAQYGYPFYPVTQLYQLRLLVKHLSRRLPRIRIPVQTIQAKDDDMASARNSKYIYDRIRSRTKEMVFLYNSYHIISVDQEREIVADKMLTFFERTAAGPDPSRPAA